MKQTLLVFVVLLLFPLLVQAQYVLNNFDTMPPDTFSSVYGNDDANSTYLRFSNETTEVHEGTGALRVEWQNQAYDLYGGWIGMTQSHPDSGGVYDYSLYTDMALWYYNEVQQSVTGAVEFRVILNDAGPESDGDQTEDWFTHHFILDKDPGWHKLTIKMEAMEQISDATSDDNGLTKGLWLPGSSWGLFEGNGKLDLDKIRGWQLEFSQSGSLYGQEMDSVKGVILLDEFQLEGIAPVNLVYFNGLANPSSVTMHVGWSGTAEITDEKSFVEGTNSIKWAGGGAWDAVNFTHAQPRNMVMSWSTDSLQFKIYAEAGIGDLTLNFWDVDHDPEGKDDYAFTASYTLTETSMGYDGTWKSVKVALTEFNRFAGVWDGDLGQSVPGEFDSTEVAKFSIGNMGQVIASNVYFDDVWTGNPEFDFIPPDEVTGVSGTAGAYYNLVFWNKVSGEENEVYTVYASSNPITDVTAAGIEVVVENWPASESLTATHWLQYPLADNAIDYYYAVTCKDAAGNIGPAGTSSAINNIAEGVPSIHYMPGFTFKADGNFDEWTGVPVMPWKLDCTVNNVAAGSFNDDPNDLSPTAYVAVDDQYLYVAVDVIDDSHVYSSDQVGSWWTQDAFEFFIGMWDQNGKGIHTAGPSDSRGEEPDYKLIFLEDRYYNEYKNNYNGDSTAAELEPDASGNGSYYYEVIDGDYIMEARIALDSIAFGNDVPLNPQNGMRIMFDLVFHDNDEGQGGNNNLTWSPNNRDLAYLNQAEWTNTWIGDTTYVDEATSIGDGNGNIVGSYDLRQNYPNPFNPETTIKFAIAKAGDVEIKVFNMLGQNVVTLVNQKMNAGTHQVKFDGYSLASGIYFYTIRSGDFLKTRKMILLK